MTEKHKIVSLKEKEKKIFEKIEKAKNELSRLQEKRRGEMGKLACKHGLDTVEDEVLDNAFAELAKGLLHGNSSTD